MFIFNIMNTNENTINIEIDEKNGCGSSFGVKLKNEIIKKIKYEFEKNQTDLINPIINYMIDQFHFEFKTYLIIAELGLLLVILLFIINICFIFWISNKLIFIN